MGHDHNGSAHLVYLFEQKHKLQAAHGIEIAGRLIRDDHARAVDERPCDGDTLLLAAGELIRHTLASALKPYKLQYVRHTLLDLGVCRADNAHRKCDVIVHVHVFDKPVILEYDAEGAQKLVDNGCIAVFEGANMPLTPEAIEIVKANGLLYSPGKASNAGGVATSGLEMSQNSIRMSWNFDEVDEKLHGIMQEIYKACYDASVECGKPGDLMVGANVAGFLKVADAMMAQGIV